MPKNKIIIKKIQNYKGIKILDFGNGINLLENNLFYAKNGTFKSSFTSAIKTKFSELGNHKYDDIDIEFSNEKLEKLNLIIIDDEFRENFNNSEYIFEMFFEKKEEKIIFRLFMLLLEQTRYYEVINDKPIRKNNYLNKIRLLINEVNEILNFNKINYLNSYKHDFHKNKFIHIWIELFDDEYNKENMEIFFQSKENILKDILKKYNNKKINTYIFKKLLLEFIKKRFFEIKEIKNEDKPRFHKQINTFFNKYINRHNGKTNIKKVEEDLGKYMNIFDEKELKKQFWNEQVEIHEFIDHNDHFFMNIFMLWIILPDEIYDFNFTVENFIDEINFKKFNSEILINKEIINICEEISFSSDEYKKVAFGPKDYEYNRGALVKLRYIYNIYKKTNDIFDLRTNFLINAHKNNNDFKDFLSLLNKFNENMEKLGINKNINKINENLDLINTNWLTKLKF